MNIQPIAGPVLMFLMVTFSVFAQETPPKITLFMETAAQSQELWQFLQTHDNIFVLRDIAERGGEISEKIPEALKRLETLQKQNTLCDDGIGAYLKAWYINLHTYIHPQNDAITPKAVELLLNDLKSPMEEKTLGIAAGWTIRIVNPEQGLRFFHPRTVIPMRGSSSPIKYDFKPGEIEEIIHWSRLQAYPIPFPFGNVPLALPYQFKALGLYDKAWRSFFEELNPFYSFKYDGSRSAEVGVHWQNAADCAYRAGEKRLGWNLLMKAAVFSNEKTLEQVKETATLWLECEENNKELPPPAPFAIPWYHSRGIIEEYGMKEFEAYLGSNYDRPESRAIHIMSNVPANPRLRDAMLRRIGKPGLTEEEIRRECWDYIIETYMKMNAHPRAWALVDEYPEEFENPEELKKKIQNDWLDLVGRLIQTGERMRAKKVEVYGHVLLLKESEDENGKATFRYPVAPLDVTIPWAFPEGSVEQAKQELRKILNEFRQAEEESP